MKKIFISMLVFTIPILLSLTVWQSYRFSTLERDVKKMEITQKEMFEKNKKTIMGIEFLKSPFRINAIAEKDLKLKKVDPNKVIRIKISEEGDDSND